MTEAEAIPIIRKAFAALSDESCVESDPAQLLCRVIGLHIPKTTANGYPIGGERIGLNSTTSTFLCRWCEHSICHDGWRWPRAQRLMGSPLIECTVCLGHGEIKMGQPKKRFECWFCVGGRRVGSKLAEKLDRFLQLLRGHCVNMEGEESWKALEMSGLIVRR